MNRTNKITKETASRIAKDLVEGGIKDRLTVRVTAQAHHVSQAVVLRIKAIILRNAPNCRPTPSYNATRYYDRAAAKQVWNNHLCSMVDAIANGWEGEEI